jgi:hypothetical protein
MSMPASVAAAEAAAVAAAADVKHLLFQTNTNQNRLP